MPRRARIKNPYSIYHIIIRGVNRQSIFNEEKDYKKFLEIIESLKEKMNFELYAYCLMSNHVHLLIRENQDPISSFMQRLSGKYAIWFNKKYDRVGYLFQNRFRSEPIESERYFFTALRYIHMNPVKAGICIRPEEYPYSSYGNYFKDSIIAHSFILEIIDEEGFQMLHSEGSSHDSTYDDTHDDTLGLKWEGEKTRLKDEEAMSLMKEICGCITPSELQQMEKKKMKETIAILLKRGVNITQANRITGVSKYIIRKCM